MPPPCRKCPYFEKNREKFQKGKIILGRCKLRNMNISDETVNNELCKDRAVIPLSLSAEEKKPSVDSITF